MKGSKGRGGEVPGAATRRIGQPAGVAGPRPIASAVALALLALNGMHPEGAHAAPAGEQLVGGAATVLRPNAQTTVIDQTSQRAALNWTRFGIAAGESVIFRQPSASAVALNRVTGSEASHIYGSLQANGQVFLVNPNGVTFARGASVDVGGIVASTLGITNNDFMAGRFVFSGGSTAGAIENHANIRAANGGYVAFLGNQVTNTGTITANRGSVAFGAGDTMQLDFHGDGLLTLKVDTAAANAKLENSGVITADGGQVFLSARAKNALVSTAINMDGVITAKGLTERNGKIVLDGGRSGVTRVSGTLDASSDVAGQKGGEIRVLGEYVGLFGNAKLDASGVEGGGTVLVGGDFQGRNPDIQNAFRAYVGPNASIKADAIANGDGGKVIVWADDSTRFHGRASVRGGSEAGNGGLVETSGKNFLSVAGARIDARAPRGAAGTWLLDPTNIEVVAGGANATLADVDQFADPDQGGAGNSRIAPADLDAGGANVVLQAQNDITFTDAVNLTTTANANLTAQAGRTLTVNNTITTNGSGRVTLVANNTGNAETDAAGGALTGSGGINRQAGAGNLNVNAAITSGTGDIKLVSSAATTDSGVPGNVALGANVTTAGNVTITAAGAGSVVSGAGVVAANGLTVAADAGIALNTNVSTLNLTNTTSGNAQITEANALDIAGVSFGGTGTATIATTNGSVTTSGDITATGNGSITLGAGGAGSTLALSNAVSAANGTVTLNAATSISQGGGAITAATLAGNAGTTASLGQNNAVTNLGAFTTNGAFTLVDTGGVNVTGAVTTTNNGLASITTSGVLAVATGGSVAGAGVTLATTGAGSNITLDGPITGNAGPVTLDSAGSISQTGFGAITTAGTLTTTSVGGTLLAGAPNNVAILSATNTTSGFVVYQDTDSVSVSGSNTGSGFIITAAGGGTITVDAGNLNANGGSVFLGADEMVLTGTVTGNGGVTLRPSTPGRVITLGVGTAGLDFSNAALQQIFTTGELTIGTHIDGIASGTITIDGPIAGGTSWTTLSLRTGGAVVDGNAAPGPDITVGNAVTQGNLAIRAATGIGSPGDPLETSGGGHANGLNLAYSNTGAGGVSIANTGRLNIADVDGLSQSNGGSGATAITASSPLNITASVIQAGAIDMTAGEDAGAIAGDDLTVADGVTVRSTAGDVILRAGDNVVIGPTAAALVESTNAGGRVTLISGFNDNDGVGAITGAGRASAPNVVLDALTGVGAAGTRFSTTAGTLAARTRTSGGVFVTELDGVILDTIGGVANGTAGGGSYDLAAGGTITVAAPVTAADVGAVTLTATGATSDVLFDATVSSATGAIRIDAGRNITLNAGSLSTGGDVTLNAAQAAATGTISEGGAGTISGRLLTTSSRGGTTLSNNNGVARLNASNSGSGNVSLANTRAQLAIDGIAQTGGGDISVNNTGSLSTVGAITTGGDGNISLTATGDSAIIGTPVTAGGAGTLSITATGATGDVFVSADAGSTSGAITVNAGRSVYVMGNLSTGGNVTLTAATGEIAESGTGAISGALLTTNSAMGTRLLNSNTVTSFNASNSGSENVELANTAATLTVTGITQSAGRNVVVSNNGNLSTSGAITTAADGNIFLTATGGTATLDAAVTAGGAGNVNLAATGAAGDVLLNATAGSTSGAITINAGRNVTLNGGSLATGGNVTLNSALAAAAGTISEAGAGTITGARLTTSSGGGTTLNNANTVGSFSATNATSGNIELVNTANPLTVSGISNSGGGSVTVTNTGSLTNDLNVDAGSGNVTLTAAGANSLLTNNGNIASAASVELNADRMALGGSIATTPGGAGKVPLITLMPVTAGRAISIGGDDDAGTLGLTQAELNTAHATTLRVGSTAAGAITIDSNVVLSAFDNLHLRTGSTISGITSSLGVSGLLLEAASANISNPSNDVITLAGTISGAGSPFTYTGDGSGVIIGTIAGVSGIMTNNGNVNVTTTGAITVNAPIVAGTATVALQGSSITSNGTTGSVTANTLNTVSTIGSTLLNSLGNDVTTYSGQANTAGSTITFVDTNGFNLSGIAAAGSEARLLASAGAITQTAGTIVAGQLSVVARDSSSFALAGNDIGILSASLTGAGQSLVYRDSNAFNAGLTALAPAGANAVQTNAGNVTLTADTGTLTIADPIAAAGATVALNATAGAIAQNAGGGVTADTLTGTAGTSAALTGNNAITNLGAFTTNGAFTLNDAGGLNVTGAVTTQNGGAATIATGGTLAVTTGSIFGAGVALTTTAGGDITLNGPINGNAGDVALTSAGLISQTATGLINTTGALTGSAAATAILDQANTVGGLGPFTTGGNFTVNDTTGGLTLFGAVNAGSAAVSITTVGGPLALQSNSVSGIAGVTLQGVGVTSAAGSVIATAAAANSGTASGAVMVTTTGAGAIALGGNINTAGAEGSGAAAAAGGNVTLTTANGPISVAVVNAAGGDGTGGNANGADAGTIAFNVGGANTLTLNGNVTSRGGDAAGAGNAGAGRSLNVAAPTRIGGDVTIDTRRGAGAGAAAGGSIAFASTIDADAAAMNRKLTASAPTGTVAFSGNIGAAQALADLDVTASSIVFSAGGAQSVDVSAQGGNTATFAGPVTLAQNLAFNTTGAGVNSVTFANAVNADAFASNRTLNVTTGTGSATFGGGVGVGAGQELGAFTVAGNQLVMSGDVRVNGGGAVDFMNLANVSFTPGASIDTDRAGGATAAGNILFGATTRANPTAVNATWTLDANADGGGAAGNVRAGTIGNVTGLNVLNVIGDRVTFAGPVNAVQVFVTANKVETTGDGRIFATRGFDGTAETQAALSLRALTGEGSFGERNAPIQIAAPGLFFVLPNGSNTLAPVFLAGDPNLRPVYQFAEDPSARVVFYNGAAPDSPANRSAQSAITQQLRQLLDEINQAGFSKENIRRQLLQGVILETGLSRPGIDDFVGEGVTAPPSCNGVMTPGGKIDCP